eukprot:Gb_34737 [translate_table: standard]
MKIAAPLLAKKAVLVLRALAKAAMPMVRAEVNKVKDVVVHGSAKKKKNNHEGGIAIRSSRPAMDLDLDLDFMPPKLLSKERELTRGDARAYNSALAVISCDGSAEHEERKSMAWLPVQRIDEDASLSSTIVVAKEINHMADAFIHDFHKKMRLEKQQSYRRYEDMLARGT